METMQTWLLPIKEPENKTKQNLYGWLLSPSDLPSSPFAVIFSNAHPPPTSPFPPQDA
jgi:hypothetical protein